MAKRFTDTDKWKRGWFLNLGSKLRDLRQFILDDCDHAGIWDLSLKRLGFMLGDKFTEDDIKAAFRDKIQIIGDRIFIPDFIEFQYGAMNQSNKVHRSVLERLKKFGFNLAPLQGAWEGALQGAKDKEQEKDKDQDKERGESEGSDNFCHKPEKQASVVNFKSEPEVYKYAIRAYGHPNAKEAKEWLGDDRWQNVKRLGGWLSLCQMKQDDFFDKRLEKIIYS